MTAITTVKEIQNLAPGSYAVEGVKGLKLKKKEKGGFFFLRYQLNGKRRDFSCGASPAMSLGKAREKAKEARRLIDQGIDPIQVRDENAARAAAEAQKAIISKAII